ncbi:MAG: hypothetical protein E7551_02510 [Ruminococcaceae bacterium]|nr:hypothetical protein [Oscillospiraceae bacterium]
MNYNFSILNNSLIIAYGNRVILSGIKIRINYLRSKNILYIPNSIEADGNKTTVIFERNEFRNWMKEEEYVNLVFTEENGVLLAKAEFACHMSHAFNYTYHSVDSAFIDYEIPKDKECMLNLQSQNPFWIVPSFVKEPKDFEIEVATVSYKIKNQHIYLLPLINKEIRTHIEQNSLAINIGIANKSKISSNVFMISSADEPFAAISNCFSVGRSLNAITVPPATQRKYPKEFEGFGWCTWNAYYKDVTSQKIYEKLDEFKAKGIKVSWLLVDDGWLSVKDNKLLSFKEDTEKFPEGFKGFTKKVKEEYGIKYVGVWHAFGGYWCGFHQDGEIYRDYADLLFTTSTGWIYPSEDEEKAFKLWDIWHSYLKEQGIDFVKVDNQSASSPKYDCLLSGALSTAIQHAAIEKSVFKNFNGAIINCMGCKMEENLTRPMSAINRNSDDYYPAQKHSFIKHINQNVYVSPVHNEMHICDFDMFWTEHETATVSGVLRAISGGPVYTSDENGKTNCAELRPIITPNGDVWRFEQAAKVTKDLFYTECSTAEVPLKVWNKSGENFVLAAFGITIDKTVKGTFKLSDIPNANGRYLVHDFFNDKYFVLDNEGEINIETDYNKCALYSLYKISDDNTVKIGDKNYYTQVSDPNPKTVILNDILNS